MAEKVIPTIYEYIYQYVTSNGHSQMYLNELYRTIENIKVNPDQLYEIFSGSLGAMGFTDRQIKNVCTWCSMRLRFSRVDTKAIVKEMRSLGYFKISHARVIVNQGLGFK